MQERRANDQQLRDRMTSLEVRFGEQEKRVIKIEERQEEANEKLDKILINVAEQRGAGKAIKIIWGAIVTALGFLGGIIGAGVRHF